MRCHGITRTDTHPDILSKRVVYEQISQRPQRPSLSPPPSAPPSPPPHLYLYVECLKGGRGVGSLCMSAFGTMSLPPALCERQENGNGGKGERAFCGRGGSAYWGLRLLYVVRTLYTRIAAVWSTLYVCSSWSSLDAVSIFVCMVVF